MRITWVLLWGVLGLGLGCGGGRTPPLNYDDGLTTDECLQQSGEVITRGTDAGTASGCPNGYEKLADISDRAGICCKKN